MRRRSRRQRQQQGATIRRHALHEAGHAVAAELLGLPVTIVRVRAKGGSTWHRKPPDTHTAALAIVAGVVAEALDPTGPQSPVSWQTQPDRAELARLPAAVVGEAFMGAMRLLLTDPDTQTAVLALAGVLERRRVVSGWGARRIIENPHRYRPRPPRRRNGPPDAGYIRRSIGG